MTVLWKSNPCKYRKQWANACLQNEISTKLQSYHKNLLKFSSPRPNWWSCFTDEEKRYCPSQDIVPSSSAPARESNIQNFCSMSARPLGQSSGKTEFEMLYEIWWNISALQFKDFTLQQHWGSRFSCWIAGSWEQHRVISKDNSNAHFHWIPPDLGSHLCASSLRTAPV